jgi:hypothetical protein
MNLLTSIYISIRSALYNYNDLIGKQIIFDDEKAPTIGKAKNWIRERDIPCPRNDERYLRIRKESIQERPIFYTAERLKGRIDIDVNLKGIVTSVVYE